MMRYSCCLCMIVCLVAAAARGQESSDASDVQSLQAQIDLLQAKLNVAEQTIKLLEKELESTKKSAPAKEDAPQDSSDSFTPGVVWVGEAKGGPAGKVIKWALSISERDGNKFSGAVAGVGDDGKKIEFPVSGVAPANGNGLVTVESPLIGRAKVFMRGRMMNGQMALAISGVNPLGDKFFGAATLRPAH